MILGKNDFNEISSRIKEILVASQQTDFLYGDRKGIYLIIFNSDASVI